MLVSSGQNACAQITAASCLSRVVKAPVLKLRPFISLVLSVPIFGRTTFFAKFESLQGYITAAHAFETNVEIRIAGSAGRPQLCTSFAKTSCRGAVNSRIALKPTSANYWLFCVTAN